MNIKRLEEYPAFNIIAWMVVIGFVLFTLKLILALVRFADELSQITRV